MKTAAFLVSSDPENKPNLRAQREEQALSNAGWECETDSVTLLPAPKGFFSRVMWFRKYTHALAEMPLTVSPKPDVIIAHDLYTLPAGRIAARKLGVPLVYDAHEPWPELIGEYSRLEALAARWTENRPYGLKIDHAFVPCEPLADRFRKMGIPSTVLFNARSSKDIMPLMDRKMARTRLGYTDDDFVVGYIGAMKQLLNGSMYETLFDAISELPKIKLAIIGGPRESADFLRERAPDRVRIEDQMPFNALLEFYSSLDLGLILLDVRPIYTQALPNKLFDYMAFGVPVLAPDYSEIAKVIDASRCGMLMPSLKKRPEFLAVALELAQESPTTLRRMGENGRKAFLESYAWENHAPKFVRVVNDLCGFFT